MVNEIKTIEKKDAPVIAVNELKPEAVVEIQPQTDVKEEGKAAEDTAPESKPEETLEAIVASESKRTSEKVAVGSAPDKTEIDAAKAEQEIISQKHAEEEA
jgi:hypothetical protein